MYFMYEVNGILSVKPNKQKYISLIELVAFS